MGSSSLSRASQLIRGVRRLLNRERCAKMTSVPTLFRSDRVPIAACPALMLLVACSGTGDRVAKLHTGTPKADVLKALGTPLPAGSLSPDLERLPKECASQFLYKDTPDNRVARFVQGKVDSGGMWYRICFDEHDKTISGLQFIMVHH
jgi:hypothetical protein